MSTPPPISTNKRMLSNKFEQFEAIFYKEIDELDQILDELDLQPPGVKIEQFQFINDWYMGTLSSGEVFAFLDAMDLDDVARKQVTRQLTAFMFKEESSAEVVKQSLEKIKASALPIYTNYLRLLKIYFRRLSQIDEHQVPLVWVEMEHKNKEESPCKITEMSVNQFILYFDSYFFGGVEKAYVIGNNVAVFQENEKYYHWIFAPQSYIDCIRDYFEIKGYVSPNSPEARDYLTTLLDTVDGSKL
jgi:hypothetical protein